MTGRDSEAPRSVFHTVDQAAVLHDFGQNGDDAVGSDFFDAALRSPGAQPADAFAAGVAAFTGLEARAASSPDVVGDSQRDGRAGPTVSPAISRTVDFTGDILGNDAAMAAFILRGPAGVRRIA